jgi:hypothetical protein
VVAGEEKIGRGVSPRPKGENKITWEVGKASVV